MTKIVNSAWPRSRGGDPCEPNHAAERVVHHTGGNSSVSCRKEHVVVRYGQLAAPIEVAVEHVRHRRVQGDESALPELCPPDQQSSVGLQVIEPQIERLRDAQARCGDEPEERRVHLASEWICPSQSAGGLDLQYGYDAEGNLDTSVCTQTLVNTGDKLRDNPALAEQLAAGGPLAVHGVQITPKDLVKPANVPPFGSWFVDFDGYFEDRERVQLQIVFVGRVVRNIVKADVGYVGDRLLNSGSDLISTHFLNLLNVHALKKAGNLA